MVKVTLILKFLPKNQWQESFFKKKWWLKKYSSLLFTEQGVSRRPRFGIWSFILSFSFYRFGSSYVFPNFWDFLRDFTYFSLSLNFWLHQNLWIMIGSGFGLVNNVIVKNINKSLQVINTCACLMSLACERVNKMLISGWGWMWYFFFFC